MSEKVLEVGADDFVAQVLSKSGAVVVDYWAPWCAPCVALTPAIERVADERPDISVLKLNLDEHEETAVAQGVTSLPTIILYKDGAEIERLTGTIRPEQLQELVAAV